MMIDKADKYKIRKRLDEIDRKTSINRAEKTRLLKACVCYFEKTNVFLPYFERSTLKRNLTYSCFSSHCFTKIYSLSAATTRYPPP